MIQLAEVPTGFYATLNHAVQDTETYLYFKFGELEAQLLANEGVLL